MKTFLDQHFLLNTETAIQLYENAIPGLPIFDFHCHLDPQEIWENKNYQSITQLWLGGDHYKWRVMRIHGIEEKYITGEATDWEKFEKWAETVPHLIGNPLYHWTHMELKLFFGVDKLLNPDTAREIFETCNNLLKRPEFTPRAFIERSHVNFIGTTDDPVSTLDYHNLLKNDETFRTIIAPTFRPDGALYIERSTFTDWLKQLSKVSGIKTDTFDGMLEALKQRVDHFHKCGGRASDHDIQELKYKKVSKPESEAIYMKRLSGQELSTEELNSYRLFLLKELGKWYSEKEWVMQLHMGALRNNNSKMMARLGKDKGFDSIGESNFAQGLSNFLDDLDNEEALPRTVLFNLNPKDNFVFAAMMGNFFEEGVSGKIQFGSGWWFNDHIDGMERQMRDLANVGMLSHFIGMLTDSRSFLSYARHDYFRRILCNLLGDWVEKGLVPYDMDLLVKMVKDIGYYNTETYFLNR